MRSLTTLLLVPAVSFAIYACSGEDDAEQEGAPSGWQDVRLDGDGGTTDDALGVLAAALGQPPVANPSQAQTLTAPPAGALSRTMIPTFSWAISPTAGVRGWQTPPSRFANAGDAFGLAAQNDTLQDFTRLFGPVRLAHAHGTPFSGTGTLLTFASASNPKLLRVFTASASFTPVAADWDKLVAAGSFSLELVSAVFADNRILQDGGPYQGSKTEFTVAP